MARFSLLFSVWAGVWVVGHASDARACGGLFCNAAQPVIQTGEGIVFTVDRNAGTIDAVINIRFQGAAPEFAWVLPLQSAPNAVRVAPNFLFATVDRLTAPQFPVSFETRGGCIQAPQSGGLSGDAGASAGDAGSSGPRGVEVLFRDAVGPYDSVVIQSSNPEELRTWLEENGYAVTDEMMEAVVPYVANGDALLALKLLSGKSAGDIQPIWLTMTGNEVCVPIRLTAIAAIDDMEITTTVFSNEGRAIPENYFHVDLNLARIDWMNGGVNYRQLVTEAADEGSGNAFVTEYSGSARIFDAQLYLPTQYDRGRVETMVEADDLILELQQQSLTIHPEVAAILLEAIGEMELMERGVTAASFSSCPGCFSFLLDGLPVDVHPIAAAIWDRVVEPLENLQGQLDSFATATRLYTSISPEEMTIDPDFVFRPELPDVSNIHRATAIIDCTGGLAPGQAPVEIHIEETGQIVGLRRKADGSFDDDYLDSLPAAIRIEQLAQGLVVEDHTVDVSAALARGGVPIEPGMTGSRDRSECGCSSTRQTRATPSLGLFALAGLALVVAKTPRRRFRLQVPAKRAMVRSTFN